MSDLQSKAIACLLDDPRRLHIFPFNTDWFTDGKLHHVAVGIYETRGEFTDYSQLVQAIKAHYPFTNVTAEWCGTHKFESIKVQNYQTLIQALREEYHTDRVAEASKAYANNPTKRNLQIMTHAMQLLAELDEGEDDGSLDEAAADIEYQIENDREGVIKVFSKVNRILGGGIEPARMIAVGGRPATGKTAYVLNMALEAMEQNDDVLVSLFSLEMPKVNMMKRLVSNLSQLDITKMKDLKNWTTQEEKRSVMKSVKYIKESRLKIYDKHFSRSAIAREITKRTEANKGTPHLVIIDYLQLIDTESNAHSRQAQIGEVTREMKRIANRLDVPIVLLSQLGRGSEGKEKPTLADFRESGDIEQDVDIAILLHKDKEDEHTIFAEIAKNRDGAEGTLSYRFIKSKMTFEEVE